MLARARAWGRELGLPSRINRGPARPSNPTPVATTSRHLSPPRPSTGLAPAASCLTPVHTDFVLVCLKAKAYSAAAAVLDVPVLEVQPEVTGLATLDMLR